MKRDGKQAGGWVAANTLHNMRDGTVRLYQGSICQATFQEILRLAQYC